jgi:hypothetical protein
MDAVEILTAHAVDQRKRALARLLEQHPGPSAGQ